MAYTTLPFIEFMFSVDNFYDFFYSYYGWHKTKANLWIFHPHGSKKIKDAKAVHTHGHDEFGSEWQKWSFDKRLSKTIIMHDQEIFCKNYITNTYKEHASQKEKGAMWDLMTQEEIFLMPWQTCSWPILCHSEINSSDVDWATSTGAIECYYFWHGLVSRDWFRHWRHCPDLHQTNNWQKKFLLYIRNWDGTREYRIQVKKRLMNLKDQIDCDWEGTRQISSDYSAKIVVEDAINTAIHLVAETIFDGNKIHVTEKTFKPMVMNQPFILFASSGTLKYLREYGFKTFADIWDESYDLVTDPDSRLDKIVNLINLLYQLPESEFRNLINRCRPIVEHNRQWFFSNEFEKILLDELHSNMQTALKKQNEKENIDPGGSIFYGFNSLRQRNVPLVDTAKLHLSIMLSSLKSANPSRYQKIAMQYPWVKEIK